MDGGATLDVSNGAMLIDTNVLVAAFSPREGNRHSDALGLIENPASFSVPQWLVPLSVVVEAWGMLTRNGNKAGGYDMLAWLNDPGNPVIFCRYAIETPQRDPPISLVAVVEKHHVDVVDALLIAVAEEISVQCDMRPGIRVATFDTRDFPRLRRVLGTRIRIFDMNSLDSDDEL